MGSGGRWGSAYSLNQCTSQGDLCCIQDGLSYGSRPMLRGGREWAEEGYRETVLVTVKAMHSDLLISRGRRSMTLMSGLLGTGSFAIAWMNVWVLDERGPPVGQGWATQVGT